MTLTDHLQRLRRTAIALVESVPETDQRKRHHNDLSPLLWHLGHILYIEQHWILERIAGYVINADKTRLFRSDGVTKALRSRLVPDIDTLRAEMTAWASLAEDMLSRQPAHPLLDQDYLCHFLVQHHAQHIETMQQILFLYQCDHAPPYEPRRTLEARPPLRTTVRHPAGPTVIGTDLVRACDNERPAHYLSSPPFFMHLRPVSNAEFLRFILDDGYGDRRWWTAESWQWRETHKIAAPLGWRHQGDGRWYGLGPTGPHDLDAGQPVSGLSAYEAQAFARYAGCRLPHEYEWECAAREGCLEGLGGAWEWCANAFYPYPGFRAAPYRGYSMPWFDGIHRTLRGWSPFSDKMLQRPTFRNFHTPEKRYVFAGLRLCRDP